MTRLSVDAPPLLAFDRVSKDYVDRRLFARAKSKQVVRAVDHLSFGLQAGETLGLVGESGCGKSTTARLALRLEKPSEGRILFRDRDVGALGRKEQKDYRRSVQAVFQDPASSLNPRLRVRTIIAEPLNVVLGIRGRPERRRVLELLELVGLDGSVADSFPHELSGGMSQRVAIARALAPQPLIVVLDEPVSSLDALVRAQIISLLREIQSRERVSYLFIAHDLAAVRHLSDRVAVMYAGEIVELGPSDEVLARPRHPYSKMLLEASRVALEGDDASIVSEAPPLASVPSGCRFYGRCPVALDKCATEPPQFTREAASIVRCHLYGPQ